MCINEYNRWRLSGCIVDLIAQPSICLLGLILNILCLIVFCRARTHPLVPALIVLSACDLLQLLLSLFVLFIPALHDFTNFEKFGTFAQLAYLSTGLLSPLLLASNCASIWTITYISVQRHKAILSPLRHMRRTPRPFGSLLVIVLSAMLFNALKWAEYNWRWFATKEDEEGNATKWILIHEPSSLARDSLYRQSFDHMLYPLLVYLIPLLVLTVLNLRILRHISLHRPSMDQKSRLSQERRSVTLLISIVILFFICHTAGLAIRFMGEYEDTDWFIFFKDFTNLLFNFNSFANPMLYFFFTRQFRDLRIHLGFQPKAATRVGFYLHSHNTIASVDRGSYIHQPHLSTSRLRLRSWSLQDLQNRPASAAL